MRQNLEPLKYSTLAPSRYLVYVHASEYARLEGILGIVQQQTIRALNEELDALNTASRLRRYAGRVFGKATATVENAAPEWHVEFLADPDGDLQPGDVLVDSELLLPASPELGVGERTRRITTVHLGSSQTGSSHTASHQTASRRLTRGPVVVETPASRPVESSATTAVTAQPALARITYDDDSGAHAFDVVKASVSVGRGGVAFPVDIRIASSPDVSREHARIRHDAETGAFFLIDLSSLGTTLDGQPVPRGYDDADGSKRENGAEIRLPDRARIGLAGVVFLEFQVVRA
jgi:pSer/pThr/pTyr-binding forkhead associated (FHA) protein